MENSEEKLRQFELSYLPKETADIRKKIFTEIFRKTLVEIDKKINEKLNENPDYQKECNKLYDGIFNAIHGVTDDYKKVIRVVNKEDSRILLDIMVVAAVLIKLAEVYDKLIEKL